MNFNLRNAGRVLCHGQPDRATQVQIEYCVLIRIPYIPGVKLWCRGVVNPIPARVERNF
jgi:hypothetical protein